MKKLFLVFLTLSQQTLHAQEFFSDANGKWDLKVPPEKQSFPASSK